MINIVPGSIRSLFLWHETYETTTDKTLAYFKDKNAQALCFVEK